MNSGYGYSVWYVPNDYLSIMDEYDIQHIPHVTIATNLASITQAEHVYLSLPTIANIIITSTSPELFPSMYANDPLKALGWFVEFDPQSNVPSIRHTPHISTLYFTSVQPPYPPLRQCAPIQGYMRCNKFIADTRSGDPSQWCLVFD